jgi:hypothetical protein
MIVTPRLSVAVVGTIFRDQHWIFDTREAKILTNGVCEDGSLLLIVAVLMMMRTPEGSLEPSVADHSS